VSNGGTGSNVTYRQAREDDVAAQHAVFVAAEGELLERHGFAWRSPPLVDAVAPGYLHLLRHDGERCFVAEADGRVVGYSAGFVRGAAWFLASLFIDPAYQGVGVGRRLMGLALSGAPERRLTISDSIQPVSNALYAKHGLYPITPILGFKGPSKVELASDLSASEITPSALAMLDQAAYGFDRSVDHEFWATQAVPTLWRRGDKAVAYSYRWPTGRIGPLAGLDDAAAAAALAAELAQPISHLVQVPGTSTSMVRVAIEAGLELAAPPGLLLLSEGVAPPRSLAISSYGLY
jgi:ribosomal protein S18 acetylase RimI-like enzyme